MDAWFEDTPSARSGRSGRPSHSTSRRKRSPLGVPRASDEPPRVLLRHCKPVYTQWFGGNIKPNSVVAYWTGETGEAADGRWNDVLSTVLVHERAQRKLKRRELQYLIFVHQGDRMNASERVVFEHIQRTMKFENTKTTMHTLLMISLSDLRGLLNSVWSAYEDVERSPDKKWDAVGAVGGPFSHQFVFVNPSQSTHRNQQFKRLLQQGHYHDCSMHVIMDGVHGADASVSRHFASCVDHWLAYGGGEKGLRVLLSPRLHTWLHLHKWGLLASERGVALRSVHAQLFSDSRSLASIRRSPKSLFIIVSNHEESKHAQVCTPRRLRRTLEDHLEDHLVATTCPTPSAPRAEDKEEEEEKRWFKKLDHTIGPSDFVGYVSNTPSIQLGRWDEMLCAIIQHQRAQVSATTPTRDQKLVLVYEGTELNAHETKLMQELKAQFNHNNKKKDAHKQLQTFTMDELQSWLVAIHEEIERQISTTPHHQRCKLQLPYHQFVFLNPSSAAQRSKMFKKLLQQGRCVRSCVHVVIENSARFLYLTAAACKNQFTHWLADGEHNKTVTEELDRLARRRKTYHDTTFRSKQTVDDAEEDAGGGAE